ncbi:MAG: sulfurtransferase [Roseivivax sp.]|nr:sulfurtransferase [Roseivivax sp.]
MFALFNRSAPAGFSAADAVAKHSSQDIVLIDIRDGSELAMTGRAKGALHVPMAAMMTKCDPRSPECLPELKSGKPIAVYCASGARSAMACRALSNMGHAEVHNIGGLGHWQAAGGVVER